MEDSAEEAPRRAYVVETILGVFGVDGGNEILEEALYPRDPEQIAAALDRQLGGELTREVTRVVECLIQRGFKGLVFTNRALAAAARSRWGVEVEVEERSGAVEHLRDNLERLAVERGVVEETSQLYGLSHSASVSMAKRGVSRTLSEREAIVSRTIQLLDDLDRSLNALSGKLREWHGLHFPELGRLIEDHRTYAAIAGALPDRGLIDPSALTALGLSGDEAERIFRAARASMGAPLAPEDLAPVERLAEQLSGLYGYRRSLEEYVAALAWEIAPNLSEVAGPMLAARLIEKAGGLRRLSMMPASTIQLLGAEKALFRALRSRSRPPKHGLIFQHPAVHAAPRRVRGRSARALASKLAIASRVDAFSGRTLGPQLKSQLYSKLARYGQGGG